MSEPTNDGTAWSKTSVEPCAERGDDDLEAIVAHVVRGNDILATVIIEPVGPMEYGNLTQPQWRVWLEPYISSIVVSSQSLAVRLADQYLEGYARGYDQGFEASSTRDHERIAYASHPESGQRRRRYFCH